MRFRDCHRILGLWALGLLASAASGQCPITFAPAVSATTGQNAAGLAVADFNNDGIPDLAVANSGAANVSVLLGSGDGGFGAAMHFAAFSGPLSIAAADLNGDGAVDIVSANLNDNSIATLRGNGDGTFLPPVRIAVGATPVSVAAGDLNGDTLPDIVALHQDSGEVWTLLNQGGGVFGATPLVFKVNVGGLLMITLGDMTGDGAIDAVAVSPSEALAAILFGDGAGSFDGQMTYAAGNGALSVAVGDVSGDGSADIVVSNQGSAGASVLLGVGDGTFLPRVQYPGGGSSRRSVALADFNGDGKPDIGLAGGNGFATLRGNGDGTFQSPVSGFAGTNLGFAVAADFDGDGRPDWATSNHNTTSLFIMRNTGVSVAITEQPTGQTVAPGAAAEFGVTASGAVSYRWRRNGVPILDSRAIEGASTPNLSIAGVSAADQGVYDVQIGAACGGGVTSRPVLLIVASGSTCPGDTNGDNSVNFLDLNTVISAFNTICR